MKFNNLCLADNKQKLTVSPMAGTEVLYCPDGQGEDGVAAGQVHADVGILCRISGSFMHITELW